MKDKKVIHLASHIGIGATAMTSIDARKHEAEMELTPVGVFVKVAGPAPKKKMMEYLVPFSNLRWIELEPSAQEEEAFLGKSQAPTPAPTKPSKGSKSA